MNSSRLRKMTPAYEIIFTRLITNPDNSVSEVGMDAIWELLTYAELAAKHVGYEYQHCYEERTYHASETWVTNYQLSQAQDVASRLGLDIPALQRAIDENYKEADDVK